MQFSFKKRKQGSVLIITLFTCVVIATVLASYLMLISNRYTTTVRSMDWNAAIPVLEAGVEEAMTHLQDNIKNPTANGWTHSMVAGQAVIKKQRDFTDGSYASVWIVKAATTTPTIYSQGFVPAPLGQGYISRTVRVTTEKPKTFSAAIAANGLVSLSGGAIVDSYNSCLGPYSTNGNGLGTNGSIATNYKASPAIKVGTAHVYGTVTTGPDGSVSYSTGGTVGDADWNATQAGIQPGWDDDDMNVAFPTNAPPSGPFVTPPVIVAGGSNITWLASDTYQLSSFSSLDKTKPMIVSGDATLYVVGNLTVASSGYIKILPGASLKLYVGGSGIISGGGVVNLSEGTLGQAADFSYIGLPTSTNLSVSGSAAFVGTINAPQANFVTSGSGGVYGAAIVNTYTASGLGSGFHYDECLGSPVNYLTITGWQEL